MKRNPCSCRRWVLATIATTAIITPLLFWYNGLYINVSPSVPGLLFQRTAITAADLTPGVLVFTCPPDTAVFREARDRGYLRWGITCPGNYAPLLKPIAASYPDQVSFTPDGVRVGWRILPNSKRLHVDGQGRAMPSQPPAGLVPKQYVWLLSTHHPNSFDSRYFGALPTTAIIGKAVPLLRPATHPELLLLNDNNKERT
jgi:conjugative transfer signal peptidase TraF